MELSSLADRLGICLVKSLTSSRDLQSIMCVSVFLFINVCKPLKRSSVVSLKSFFPMFYVDAQFALQLGDISFCQM